MPDHDDLDGEDEDKIVELPKDCKARLEINIFDQGGYCTMYDSKCNASEYAFGKTVIRFLVSTINASLDESLCLTGNDVRIVLEQKDK